ncbi:MAG: hypothetical protein J6I84_02945 [Bacilli bacterium]|nr:hypothetical protein [Bacilli bacterium]
MFRSTIIDLGFKEIIDKRIWFESPEAYTFYDYGEGSIMFRVKEDLGYWFTTGKDGTYMIAGTNAQRYLTTNPFEIIQIISYLVLVESGD